LSGSGYHTDPLSVSIEYRGDGRFDDPQRWRTAPYGSDAVEICIIEIVMPRYLHSDALYVQRMEASERDIDSELLQAFDDAERGHAIATKPAQTPADLRDISCACRLPDIIRHCLGGGASPMSR
jgi:hypothetical protein